MNFYERLQKLTKENGKSFNQVEKDLGYSKNSMYQYKKTNPSNEKLRLLADYFNVSTDYLIGRTDKKIETLTPEFSVIQRRAKELTPEQQRELIDLMERAFNKLDKGELHLDESDDF